MTNAYAEAREQIRTALDAAGLHAFKTKPDHATPPLVFVGPGDPYITYEGATFGGDLLHHQLVVVGDVGTNDFRADGLDDLIGRTLDVVDELEGFALQEVRQPGQIKVNGQDCLAVAVNVISEIRRSDG